MLSPLTPNAHTRVHAGTGSDSQGTNGYLWSKLLKADGSLIETATTSYTVTDSTAISHFGSTWSSDTDWSTNANAAVTTSRGVTTSFTDTLSNGYADCEDLDSIELLRIGTTDGIQIEDIVVTCGPFQYTAITDTCTWMDAYNTGSADYYRKVSLSSHFEVKSASEWIRRWLFWRARHRTQ